MYHGTTKFVGLHLHDILNLNNKQKALYQKKYAHELFPEYYLIKVNQFNDLAKDTLDEWIYFLKNDEIKDEFRAKGLLEAKEKLIEIKLPDSEKQAYEKYLENLHDQASLVESNYLAGKIDGEKVGVEKGKAEGERIGIEKGKAEGKIEGKLEGIKESRIEIAKRMKQSGIALKLIQEMTALTPDEIETT